MKDEGVYTVRVDPMLDITREQALSLATEFMYYGFFLQNDVLEIVFADCEHMEGYVLALSAYCRKKRHRRKNTR